MRPETLELPVRAELDAAARVGNLLGAASDSDVIEIVLGRHRAAA